MRASPKKIDRGIGKTRLAVMHLIFFGLISYSYSNFLSKLYTSEGYISEINNNKILYSAIAIFLLSMIIKNDKSLRSSILNFTIVSIVSPVLTLYSCANLPDQFILSFLVFVLVFFAASAIPVSVRTKFRVEPAFLMYFLLAIFFLFLLVLVKKVGMSSFNLDFSKVYDYRRDIQTDLGGIYLYLVPIFSKCVLSLVILIACVRKNYLVIISCIILGILTFGFTSHKSILFFPLLTVFFYYACTKTAVSKYIVGVAILAMLVSIADFYYDILGGWAGYLVTGRIFMVPSLLSYDYYDFFTNNTWYWWSTSKITLGLLDSPYDRTAPFVIGEHYFSAPEMSANVGLFGSGYSQAGLFGALLYAAAGGLVVAYFNGQAKRLGVAMVLPFVIVQITTMLVSSDFLTLLLTDGVAVSIVLLQFLKTPARGDTEEFAKRIPQSSPGGTSGSEGTPVRAG